MKPENMKNPCLRSTSFIDWDHGTVLDVARSLARGAASEEEQAVRLFTFVRDGIHYNAYMLSTYPEDFKASLTLERKQGYCVQKAIVLAALGRALGIPTRLVFAKIRNHRLPGHLMEEIGTNILPAHGYSQLYLGGRWVSVTPSFDKELSEKSGMPLVEFDGKGDAVLAPFDSAGRPFIEYLERYEPEDDLPFEWLRDRVIRVWGEKRSWVNAEDSEGHMMPSGFRFPGKSRHS